MKHKLAKQRLKELQESLPDLERALERHLSAATTIADKIIVSRRGKASVTRTTEGAQIAAEARREYSKRK